MQIRWSPPLRPLWTEVIIHYSKVNSEKPGGPGVTDEVDESEIEKKRDGWCLLGLNAALRKSFWYLFLIEPKKLRQIKCNSGFIRGP